MHCKWCPLQLVLQSRKAPEWSCATFSIMFSGHAPKPCSSGSRAMQHSLVVAAPDHTAQPQHLAAAYSTVLKWPEQDQEAHGGLSRTCTGSRMHGWSLGLVWPMDHPCATYLSHSSRCILQGQISLRPLM